MASMRLFAALLLSGAVACGPSGGGGGGNADMSGGGGVPMLKLSPANATVAVVDATRPTIGYTVTAVYPDGHSETVTDATLEVSPSLGTFAGLTFTPSGSIAGTGTVSASWKGATGSTGVNVTVTQHLLGNGVPTDAPSKFTGTAQPSSTLLVDYPLDGAVMPNTVKSPNVQWEDAAGGNVDLYRIVLTNGPATVEGYVQAGGTDSFQPPADAWTLLTNSATGQPYTLTLQRWSATTSTVTAAADRSFTLLDADVRGAIYYWDLSDGKLLRIDDTGRSLLIPDPPALPSDSNNKCVACHTVSQDGRYMAVEMWGGSQPGAIWDLGKPQTLTASPAQPVVPPPTYTALFSTFNPMATRLLINNGTSLALLDASNGMPVPTMGTPLPTSGAAHPAWSPDGTLIAFIDNINGGWAVDYTSGDVAVIPVTGPDMFGAPTTLLTAGKLGGDLTAPSWPSFTPDSQFIAFGAGNNSRGRNTVNSTEVVYPGGLFLIPRAGGNADELATACGGQRNCYLPNFSPYDAGGRFWLVFYSLRDYGNAKIGTKGTNRRQMWITAIDKSKLGSGDPSAVPYWLPDQDPATDNMSAYWSKPAPIQ